MAKVRDSRRVPGVSLFANRPGAVLDVALEGEDPAGVVAAWTRELTGILREVGWEGETPVTRLSGSDLSLFVTAPADALYAATEVAELAFERMAGAPAKDTGDLIRAIAEERSPALLALAAAAKSRGVAFVPDDRGVSLGLGRGSVVFPRDGLPEPRDVPWDRVHDVPVAMVTGTNGKTTTVRLLGTIVAAAGRVPGLTTTDGLRVGDESIGSGDYSGPEGARRILRDPRVEVAVLETARGGMQRRGLVLPRIDAAAITNVAEDHIGEFGVRGVEDVADVKLLVARVVRPGGTVVLNADDPVLAARGKTLGARVAWFSLAPSEETRALSRIPIAFGGGAPHNVANAMAASRLAEALGVPREAIDRGLASFEGTTRENPGRANLVDLGGVRVLIDYAHNPHGMRALVMLARSIDAKRRLILIGQAGDRDDGAIRELARAAWALAPDRVVIKEMEAYLRGRAPGEIPRLIEDELARAGADASRIERASSEVEGVEAALRWGREGDLLVLTVHAERGEVLERIRRAQRS
ncbi:MAG TPA: Mur ligase family protein [Candidatus Polarisedimenticolaceae bacterium]|nr:Mur ligase family protein [Candidatus Polarisedimenticolaceae bacterium]